MYIADQNRPKRAQAMMEYIVVVMAVILAVSWAIGPARRLFTDHAMGMERAVRDIF